MREAMYVNTFEQHLILESGPRHWIICRPDACDFQTLIVVGVGHVACIGDGPLVAFFGGPSNPRAAVDWVAKSPLGYLASKAMMAGSQAYEYPEEAIESDLKWRRDAAVEDDRPRSAAVYEEILEGDLDLAQVQQRIVDDIPDGWEIAGEVGKRPSAAVIFGREACSALVRLLGGEP